MTSTTSSAVALGCLIATSALLILYSLSTALISSWSIFVRGTVLVIAIPPLSFLRTIIAGGCLFSRIPKPSSSDSISFLSPSGLRTSRTMKIRLHVRATKRNFVQQCVALGGMVRVPAMTGHRDMLVIKRFRGYVCDLPCRPRPLPSFAPSIIPAMIQRGDC